MAMLFPCAVYAQETFTQYLYWIRYQNQLIFNEKLYWNNEADNRRFFEPDVENQFIVHSRLHYKTGRWDFASGLTYSLGFAQKPENGYDRAFEELRPVIEAAYEIPIRKWSFQSRARLDFRFIQTNGEESVLEESLFVLRYRYRAQFRIPLKTNDENITTIGLKLAEEIMFNNKGNTFDQNRIYATGEFYLSRKISLEAGYIFIHQQRFGLDEFFDRHVARFSVLHKIYRK